MFKLYLASGAFHLVCLTALLRMSSLRVLDF
jgi:hypothetical protein